MDENRLDKNWAHGTGRRALPRVSAEVGRSCEPRIRKVYEIYKTLTLIT